MLIRLLLLVLVGYGCLRKESLKCLYSLPLLDPSADLRLGGDRPSLSGLRASASGILIAKVVLVEGVDVYFTKGV